MMLARLSLSLVQICRPRRAVPDGTLCDGCKARKYDAETDTCSAYIQAPGPIVELELTGVHCPIKRCDECSTKSCVRKRRSVLSDAFRSEGGPNTSQYGGENCHRGRTVASSKPSVHVVTVTQTVLTSNVQGRMHIPCVTAAYRR